jgi:hypothetical protein
MGNIKKDGGLRFHEVKVVGISKDQNTVAYHKDPVQR